MDNILYVSGQVPSNKVPFGGQGVAYSHLKELSQNHELHVIFFANEKEKPFLPKVNLEFCKSVKIFYISKTTRLFRYLRYLHLPAKVRARYDKQTLDYANKLIERQGIKKGFFEFTSVMHLALKLSNSLTDIEFVEHDVSYQNLYRRSKNASFLKRFMWRYEFNKMKRYELKCLRGFSCIHVLSEKDKKLLNDQGLRNVNIKYPHIRTSYQKRSIEKGSIGFVGALHRPENIEALSFFITDVYLKLRIRYDLKFYIIGANPPENLRGKIKSYDDIIITGYVEDLSEYYSKLEIIVVPLFNGAGVKIKTLEALAYGIKTFSTSVGAEGVIDNDHNLVLAECADDFLVQISNYLDNAQN